MAVYTDVSDEELDAFIASYTIGALTSFKGIAEGVENSNYLVHTETGPYILTLYEKRVRPEDLPYFLALMEHLAARGITCPLPVKDRQGCALKELAGTAGGVDQLPRGPMGAAAEHRALCGARPGAGALPSRRRRFPHAAGEQPVAAGMARAVRLDRRRRRSVAPGLTAEIEKELALSRQALAGRSAQGRDPCRSVPRQRVLSRRQSSRA